MSIDVSKWLTDIGLPQYTNTFLEQGIDHRSLRELTEADLREFGVTAMGHRKTILREAAKVVVQESTTTAPSQDQADSPQTIFLSYAHRSVREEDADFTEELVLMIQKELQQDGHIVWLDKEGIRAGDQWRERITTAILDHVHFLSFLSVRSVRDPGVCLNEIAIALVAGRHIQTVLAEDERCVAPPLTISHIQWHDFQNWREIRDGPRTGPAQEDWHAWFGQRMARLREVISDAQNARIPGELQKLREILEPRTFEARIVEKTQGFSGRRWLFEEIRLWVEESSSRLFWLKAGPGVGKSSFAAQLAHQARSAVLGFFMCDFQGKKNPEESAREAICTLAFQIATRLPDYRRRLLHEMQLDKVKVELNKRGESRTADDLFDLLITEPLNRSGKIPETRRMYLVLDGLDEAGRSDRNPLAELLAKHADRLPEWLGVLVTSRPEPYLEQTLRPLSSISIDAQSSQNRRDLAEWIDARLPPTLKGLDRLRVMDAVITKSGGAFLYLSLVERDKSLNLSEPENLPDQLDGFFRQTFNRYFPDIEQYGTSIEPFLRLIVEAPGPLSAEMAQGILGWTRRDFVLKVIEPMGSLLQHREGGFVLFHAALADWLTDYRRSGPYCVEANGSRTIGNFLWSQLKLAREIDFSAVNFPYQNEIMGWLPRLALLHDIDGMAFTIVDVETTGVSPSRDRITRIDAVKIADGNILSAGLFSQLVNPEIDIPENISALTGISNEMVKDAPGIAEALLMLNKFVAGSLLVSHNAIFPRKFLEEASNAARSQGISLPWLCTLKLSRRMFPGVRCSLKALYEKFNWEWNDSANFAMMEARLFLELRSRLISDLRSNKAITHV